ncbi:MAG: tRNA lysidine(34) synthetase TilS [Bacteroidales bacterium]|nr:tRNA lysidine(34) synthetase TilS [Bacteroidales bacterium]MBN2697286.1 tRNA lysidine(34) synthetase TilS [Bacteroidales bacterium]
MIERFKRYIQQHKLCTREDRILLAISGGVDSAVMAHLFFSAGYHCAVAHCNFHLRGEESDSDEAFTRALAAQYDMPVFTGQFETADFARDEGISVQMAARKLRYDWFDELLNNGEYNLVATAHNLNDSVETFLINMTRGSGIRGLAGIPPVNNKIIRPLLFASRKEIYEYSREHQIRFREDSSNASRKYHRNRIRHDVVPVLEDINPNFLNTLRENMERYKEAVQIFQQKVDETRASILHPMEGGFEIAVSDILQLTPISSWLFELFSPFGFTRLQCADIHKLLTSSPGRQFISTTHILYKDRGKLLLIPAEKQTFERYYLDKPGSRASLPFPMDIELLKRSELKEIPEEPHTACLDFDKIQFPLTIRHWLHGDYFIPLGMDQLKKVSDFFIDLKIPMPQKKQIWILASGKQIVWIMGLRIDNRFRISADTRQVLKLNIYDQDSSWS